MQVDIAALCLSIVALAQRERARDCAPWSKFIDALRVRQPTQERATGDVDKKKFRRRDDASTAKRSRLDIATQTPRYCRACASASSRWRLGIGDIDMPAHRRCRAFSSCLARCASSALVCFFNG
jgi:hypothetical protein